MGKKHLLCDDIGTKVPGQAAMDALAARITDLENAGGQAGQPFAVGSVIITVVETDPAILYGYGTWQAIGAGRFLVGLDSGQAEFDTLEETGGAKTHTLTVDEIPAHDHAVTDPGHTHVETQNSATTGPNTGWAARDTSTNNQTATSYSTESATTGITVDAAGGGDPHNNLPPYLVVRIWKRIA